MRILIFIAFTAIVIPILIIAHRYVWRRLIRDTGVKGIARHATTAIMVGGALSIIAGFLLMRVASREVAGTLYVIAFAWMGIMAMMLVSLVP
ncbi:MAG: hypothetical protein ACI9OJ_001567, partial [Myxococcota bacterium]